VHPVDGFQVVLVHWILHSWFIELIIINGRDIEKIINKNSIKDSNACVDCCNLAGHAVNCRTFTYKGKNYDYMPKEMIMDAIKLELREGK